MSEEKLTTKVEEKKTSNGLLRKVLTVIFRLFLVLIVGIVLGAAAYLGFQYVYQTAFVQPAQANEISIDRLETRVAELQAQAAEQDGEYNQQITELVNQLTLAEEQIDELLTLQTSTQTQLNEQAEAPDMTDEILAQIAELQDVVNANAKDVEYLLILAEEEPEIVSADSESLAVLQRKIQILQVMELLNRSRLYLIQSNYGLAELDVENSVQILEQLYLGAELPQQATVFLWIEHLESVVENLPDAPILAAEELESVWRMLVIGLPGEESMITSSSGLDLSRATPTPIVVELTEETPETDATPTPIPTAKP